MNTKLFKKLNPGVLQNVGMALIALVFIYLFYGFYTSLSEYQKSKAGKERPQGAISAIQPPEFFAFTPDETKDLNTYRLFTFDKPGKEEKAAGKGETPQPIQPKQAAYTIVGVVKKDKLFLVVRFKDRKVGLFSDGMPIVPPGTKDKGADKVHKVETGRVAIDRGGNLQYHKIFQLPNIQEFKTK
ncbi:MAG: hypothetical protein GY765_22115 [bacterium]|nr:hypothetical protein [bacterium]